MFVCTPPLGICFSLAARLGAGFQRGMESEVAAA
jgi:hypothetical protein